MSTMVLRDGLVKSAVGDSVMLYDIKNEIFYAFNETASMLVSLLGFNLALPKIKETIQGYFDEVDRDRLDAQFESFVTTLQERDLLVSSEIVNDKYVQCPITNPSPFADFSFNTYSKEWLLENHPGTFYNLCFGDMWGPGSPN